MSEKVKFAKGSLLAANLRSARKKGEGLQEQTYQPLKEVLYPQKIVAAPEHTTNITYVLFNSMTNARLACRMIMGSQPAWKCEPCCESADINWSNHGPVQPEAKVQIMAVLGYAAYFFLVLFWFIPVAFATALSNLTTLQTILPFIKPIIGLLDNAPVIKGFIEGLLPQLIIILFFMFLVPILSKIADVFFKPLTYSGNSLIVCNALYVFNFVNIYLGGILAGSFLAIFAQISSIAQSPFSVVTILGGSIPAQANFYLNYVFAAGFLKACMSFWKPIGLLIYWIKEKCLAKTARAKEGLLGPAHMGYNELVPNHNFIMLLVLTYSTIAPLMLPIALVYFLSFYLYDKYTIVFQSQQDWETGGRHFPPSFGQICASLVIYNIVMLGVFSGEKFLFGIILCALCGVGSFVFWLYVKSGYDEIGFTGGISYIVDVEPPLLDDFKENPAFDYTHPALLPIDPEELGWDTDEKRDTIWGTPSRRDSAVELDPMSSSHGGYLEDPEKETKHGGVTYV